MAKEQYDQISEKYSRMLNPTKEYILVPTFKEIVGKVEGKSVLDIGCGEGFSTRILENFNPFKIVGADYSKEMIKKAIEKKKRSKSIIEYKVADACSLELNEKFDLITAVYLLNYSETEEELIRTCRKIYEHLDEEGMFSTITIDPDLKPMKNFEYGRRFSNLSGKKTFENGDRVELEIREKGKEPFEFISHYWSKETYEKCLKKAGFKSIQWVDTIISKEGINKYGSDYWENFRQNPSAKGIVCKK